MTEKSQEVLGWIGKYIRARGYSPSVREICDGFGWSSTNAAMFHLQRLRRLGLVTWQGRHSRTIRLKEVTDASVG